MAAVPTNSCSCRIYRNFPFKATTREYQEKKQQKNNVFITTKDSVITELKNQLKHETVKTVERNMTEATQAITRNREMKNHSTT